MRTWPASTSGVPFCPGLTLSGMSDPAKVLGFLNIVGAWVPDLIFVMGGAVIVTFLLTPLVTAWKLPCWRRLFPARQATLGPTFG